ncbi:MAG: hypothetical protein ABIG37_00660 [Nanoarchaeota archaeon]|nr:hypothetical protein [Nanoarchaeota archaeon]
MKNRKFLKKGASHVEVIMSFVIFIGFFVFLFSIFNPLKIPTDNEAYLSIAERGIKDFSLIKVYFITIDVKNFNKDCFYFDYDGLSRIIVKDKDERIVEAYNDKNIIKINSGKGFYYIYSNEIFKENKFPDADCKELKGADFEFGLFRSYDMVSNKTLFDFEKKYNSDYEELKKEINFPASREFSFSVKTFDGQSIADGEKEVPATAGVLAKNIPVQVVFENGDIKYCALNIKIWG